MLITSEEFIRTARLEAASQITDAIAIDVETNGLNARRGDRAFLLGVCIDGNFFSYKLTEAVTDAYALGMLLSNPKIRYLAHNAKFEMAFFKEQFGVEIKGHVWDTEVMARVLHNNHRSYSLQACAERLGLSKHVLMTEWVKANNHKYHAAPDDLIVPYVEQDARLSYILYKEQCDTFREWENNSPVRISGLVSLEMKTTKNLFVMESAGLRLDVPYCEASLEYEKTRALRAKTAFESMAGVPFVDSAKTLTPILAPLKIPYERTEKGKDSFSYDSLKAHRAHPIVGAILDHREALKRASTYWENFLALHVGGVIYPNIRQAGAGSGRFSAAEPNVQNWPDDSNDPDCAYPIRRAFIAPEGCDIVSMDYSQMELRLIVDEAGEMGMVHDIMNGVDFHQKVADSAKVPRGIAKNARFAKLYGAGVRKIAQMLSLPEDTARRVCDEIDESSPKISRYSYDLIRYAKTAPFGYNWIGRRFFFDKGFEYKYPNYRIQGGCADILRIAMEDVLKFLHKNARPTTRCLIPIHDELVLQMDHRDQHLIAPVRQLMIDAAGCMKHLKMDVSVFKGPNMHDLEVFRCA